MKTNSNDEIISLFFTAFRSFKQKLDLGNPIYQMPLAQMETLRYVGENKTVLMKQVADYLSITPPSATVLVNNLVKMGYVARKPDKKDRRAIHLSLTKKGEIALKKGVKDRCENLAKLLNNLSGKEQIGFLKILQKMT